MNRLLLYGLIALAVVVAVTAGVAMIYRSGYSAGESSVRVEWSDAVKETQELEAANIHRAAVALEADRAKRKPIFRTITETVETIIDRPVYRNVCMDADGLRCVNAAIRGEADPGCKPDSTLRGSEAPRSD